MEDGSTRGTENEPSSTSAGSSLGVGETVFVPSAEQVEQRKRRWTWILSGVLLLAAVVVVGVLIAWPSIKKPRQLDAVETVAETYLQALMKDDFEGARKLSTVDEPPAIRSVRAIEHDRGRDRRLHGSFAPLGELHRRIESDYDFDRAAGRFTPKNALGLAAETLDALHEAKAEADKFDIAKKIESGSPDDLFDAAEQLSKPYASLAKLASGVLAPKKIVPTYAMLVESARPPIKGEARLLADQVGLDIKTWQTMLGRPFFSLKADGPFSFEESEVIGVVVDKLASAGDPPSRLRLKMVRFRLEGIDTGWKVISARRIVPEADPAKITKAEAALKAERQPRVMPPSRSIESGTDRN